MRTYATKTIPAAVREKESSKHKIKKTIDDFEVAPEHEVKQLIECRCEICGAIADRFHWEEGIEGNSTLLAIEIETYHFSNGAETRTEDFLDGWYEVCESCMKQTIVPYLKSLRGTSTSTDREPQTDEPAVVSTIVDSYGLRIQPQGHLIGAEEPNGVPVQLPPISDDEPF